MTDTKITPTTADYNKGNLGDVEPTSRCMNCLYSEIGDIDPHNPGFRPMYCRRMPPVVLLQPMHGAVAIASHWPLVKPDQWCGEHEEREVPGSQSPSASPLVQLN